MINRIIRASLENRVLVLLLTVMLATVGAYSVLHTPVDALPDLSDRARRHASSKTRSRTR